MEDKKSLLFKAAKIFGVAAVAALVFNYESKVESEIEDTDSDEALAASGRLGKSLTMWALGYGLATVGGIAALSTLGGLAAALLAVCAILVTMALFIGAGGEAKGKATEKFDEMEFDVEYESNDNFLIKFLKNRNTDDDGENIDVVDDGAEILENGQADTDDEPVVHIDADDDSVVADD